MKNTLESLYMRKIRLQSMLEEANRNGASQRRIESLEEAIRNVESLIDKENIRLYSM